MRYLPIFLDVQGRRCALIGGGEIAARKFAWLRAAGAHVRIVAPELGAALAPFIDGLMVEYLAEPFRPEHLDDCVLAVCATDQPAVNAAAAAAARARKMPVNVVDDPEQGDFIVPALIERESVTIAISTAGSSPVLARWLRKRIESVIPASIGRLAAFLGQRRRIVQHAFPDIRQRKRFWEALLEGDIPLQLSQGRETEAAAQFDAELVHAERTKTGSTAKPDPSA